VLAVTADSVLRLSPLGATVFPPLDGVAVREVPFLVQLDLRLDVDSPVAAAIGEVLGAAWPTRASTYVRAPRLDLLWLGPDEWLVLTDDQRRPHLEADLRAVIGEHHVSLVDVSAQRTALSLTGVHAAEVLARGCAIDLHPAVTPEGSCVQTLLAQAGMTLLVRDSNATDFLLLVRASFAAYVAAWLDDASLEYRISPPGPERQAEGRGRVLT
jgi:sarcosine oxidase, subunit gamma